MVRFLTGAGSTSKLFQTMPAERDRIVGELAVEQGLIARDEAARYYQLLDSQPGSSTTLMQLLLRDGRATAADVERLRDLWRARSGSSHGGASTAPAPRGGGGDGVPPRSDKNGGAKVLDEAALKKDELLARILVSRNALTVERAREARSVQLQEKARLGPLLVKRGWAERAKVEEAVRFIREQVLLCRSCGSPQDRSRLPAGTLRCPRCGGPLAPATEDAFPASGAGPPQLGAFSRPEPEAATVRGLGQPDDPFASTRNYAQNEALDSRFGPRPPAPFGGPGGPPNFKVDVSVDELDPFFAAPSAPPAGRNLSIDELNPFTGTPAGPPAGRNLSIDELNPFAAPQQPHPSAFGPASNFGNPSAGNPSNFGAPGGFFAPPAPQRDGAGFEEGPTLEMPSSPFAPPGAPAPFPDQWGGPAGSAFGGPAPGFGAPPFDSGSPGFESAPGAFGAPGFGSAPPAFGAPGFESPPGFGEPGFGSAPPAFGSPGFGSDVPSSSPFGAGSAQPVETGEEPTLGADRRDPDDTRLDRDGKPASQKRPRNTTPAVISDVEPGSRAGKIVAVLLLLLVVAGAATGGTFFYLRYRRIQDNLVKGDDAYDKKDWKAAREAYAAVLGDDKENDRATARRKDCEDQLERVLLDDEAATRLRLSGDARGPEEAVNALQNERKERSLTDDLKKKLMARSDMQVGIARAKRRFADLLRRQNKKMEAGTLLDEASKALDVAEQAKNADGKPDPLVLLERVRLVEQRKAPNFEIGSRLTELMTADPDGWCGHYARGRKESVPTVTGAAALEAAITQFDVALKGAPSPKALPEGLYWRGKAKLRASAQRRKEVKKDFQDSIAAAGDDWRPQVELAKILIDEGAVREAAGFVQTASQLAADEPEVQAIEGELLYTQRRLDEAAQRLGAAIRAEPTTLVRARRTRVFIAVDKRDKGEPYPPEFQEDLEQALAAFPDDPKLHTARARDRMSKQQWRDALGDLDAALAPEVRKSIAEREVLQDLVYRGRCFIKLDQWDKAVADLEAASKGAPEDPLILQFLGFARLGQKQPLIAIDIFTKVLPKLQGNERIGILIVRAEAKELAKMYDKAIEDLDTALKENPIERDAAKANFLRKRCADALAKQGPPEKKPDETKPPENKPADDGKAPESKPPENKPADDGKAPESKPPENKPDSKPPENKSGGGGQ